MSNNEGENTSTNLKVLEERVTRNKEFFDSRLQSYRNYGMIIAGLLTVVGVVSVYGVITQIVKNTTESKLDEILTEEYVEQKIRTKSEQVINKLIIEVETRARTIVDETFPMDALSSIAEEAIRKRDFKRAIKYMKKVIEKIPLYPDMYPGFYCSIHINLAEAQILDGDCEGALNSIKKVYPLSADDPNQPIVFFLECVAGKLLDLDNSEPEERLDALLQAKEIYDHAWSFDAMEEWIKTANISEEDKAYITEKIELIKKKKG